MHETEFVWFIPNDDNRAEDGRALREEFLDERRMSAVEHADWFELGCSFLEMLVGLSHRMAFEAQNDPHIWFWHFVETLGLTKYTDASAYDAEKVREILETVIWRTYEPDGVGGLFPLRQTHDDQREVELWYQLSAWLSENLE